MPVAENTLTIFTLAALALATKPLDGCHADRSGLVATIWRKTVTGRITADRSRSLTGPIIRPAHRTAIAITQEP
jgi:hypothetical protein